MAEYYKRDNVTIGTVDPYHAASLEKQGFVKVDDPDTAESAPAKAKRASRAKPKDAATDAAPATEATTPAAADAPEPDSDDDLIGAPAAAPVAAPAADGGDEAL